MERIRLIVHGAAGRMGHRVVALASQDPQIELVATLERDGHPQLGQDAGRLCGIDAIGIPLQTDTESAADVVVDFSAPQGAAAVTAFCRRRQLPLVMATTGLSAEVQAQLRSLSRDVAVVWSPNMSLAVNLVMKLAMTAAGALSTYASGVDVEIIERHHRFKEDAPSGTALQLGELITDIMGQSRHVHGRQGRTGKRSREEIGYHALRVGDNPGEHTVVFGMLGETVELTVRASNRDCYAVGALAAAKFAAGRPAGLYTMFDVLDL
jgi:4-hydroxy-tetrahydrodipicolinate reductase